MGVQFVIDTPSAIRSFTQEAAALDAAGAQQIAEIFQTPLTGSYNWDCLLYTSDAADERSSVDLGGRRVIKKKNTT